MYYMQTRSDRFMSLQHTSVLHGEIGDSPAAGGGFGADVSGLRGGDSAAARPLVLSKVTVCLCACPARAARLSPAAGTLLLSMVYCICMCTCCCTSDKSFSSQIVDDHSPDEAAGGKCGCWLALATRCAAAIAAALLAPLSSRICADALHRRRNYKITACPCTR